MKGFPEGVGGDLTSVFANAYECERMRNYEKAIEGYNRVIAIRSKDANAYFNRARCEFMVKKYAEAASSADTAISLNPTNPQFYQLRGLIMAEAHPNSPAIL